MRPLTAQYLSLPSRVARPVMVWKLAAFASFLAFTAATAEAQQPVVVAQQPGSMSSPNATQAAFPWTPPFAPHRHSSTAYEGAQRGNAAVIQAWANYRLQDAQARILWEQARRLAYENDIKKREAFMEKQYLAEQYRREKFEQERAREERGRERMADRRENVLYPTYKLASWELDKSTGKIFWPVGLMTDDFIDQQAEVEMLFAQLAEEGPQKDRLFRDPIITFCRDIRAKLKTMKEQFDYQEYLGHHAFLLGLELEADFYSKEGTPLTAARPR